MQFVIRVNLRRAQNPPGAFKHACLHDSGVDCCHFVDTQRLQAGTAAAGTAKCRHYGALLPPEQREDEVTLGL
jgi:hypothetical protein